MLIPIARAKDESFYIPYRTREGFCKGDGTECANYDYELRLRERLVKFLRCKFNNIGRALESRWKL